MIDKISSQSVLQHTEEHDIGGLSSKKTDGASYTATPLFEPVPRSEGQSKEHRRCHVCTEKSLTVTAKACRKLTQWQCSECGVSQSVHSTLSH